MLHVLTQMSATSVSFHAVVKIAMSMRAEIFLSGPSLCFIAKECVKTYFETARFRLPVAIHGALRYPVVSQGPLLFWPPRTASSVDPIVATHIENISVTLTVWCHP